MIELDDSKTLFSFDKDLEPVLKVPSGETVRIRTKDCFGNQLQGPEDQLSEIDWEAINPPRARFMSKALLRAAR